MGNRSSAAVLTSPVFTGAVLLLLVNDHYLKWHHPSWVTGKLSDVAGVVVLALLLRLVFRHDAAALAAAAAGFAWLKTVPGAAALAAPMLGGRTLQDHTDLLALLVLVPLWFWLQRDVGDSSRTTVPGVSMSSVVIVALALSAGTATSCDFDEEGVQRLAVDDGALWAGVERYDWTRESGEQRYVEWATSTDGGRSWQATEESPTAVARFSTRQDCTAEGTCWQVDGERVELLRDDVATEVFTFSDEDWRRMILSSRSGCDSPRTGAFGSVITDADGVVVVAMGTQGIVRFDGERWERLPVLDFEPRSTSWPSWIAWVPVVVLFVLLGASAVTFLLGLIASEPRRRSRWFGSTGGFFGATVVLMLFFGFATFVARHLYPVWAATSVVIAAALFVLSWRYVRAAGPTSSLPPPPGSGDEPPRATLD